MDDELPPPTNAQVFYWAKLCGELSLRGTAGIAEAQGWPADLVPSQATLKALQERGLVARRDRAWKLRRRWYERLAALKVRAVHTPSLALADRPAPNLPTYAELEAWEAVSRWLDVQPGRKARLPFVGLAPLLGQAHAQGAPQPEETASRGPFAAEHLLLDAMLQIQLAYEVAEQAVGEHAALLKGMRRYRLVRHTNSCAWSLSPKWCERLQDLHAGIERALREYAPSPPPSSVPARSLCAGLDTWALNWVVEEKALPARLRRELDDYQDSARAREVEVDTAWVYDGVPLRMYQAGVRAKGGNGGKGKGVSWSYILVNPSLRLLIRRTPLGGIAANARLGSEYLWRRTPRAALDELHALVRRLWGREKGRWQVSYAHLAHDVANAPLEREQLDRYVSRSRRQAVFEVAKGEMGRLLREARPQGVAGAALDDLEWDGLALEDRLYDWEAEYDEEELLLADAFAEEEYLWEGASRAVKQAKVELETDAEQRAITSYRWGKRLSGVAFSPGGAVSFVMYRKDWEGRLQGKRHMESVWKAAGWDGREPVTRHEARLVREPIRELCAAGGVSEDRALLDDPWRFLDEVPGIWARMVGRADPCPETVDVAWLRRVVPREGESNRSRWDTDPVWIVVQAAPFAPAPVVSRRLIRRHQQRHDVRMVDRGLLGLFKRREALLHADPTGRDLSLAMRDAVAGLERELAARGEQFDEAVRRKRQDCGLPVPLPGRVLPLRPRQTAEETAALRTFVEELERDLDLVGREEAQEIEGIEQEAGQGQAGSHVAKSRMGTLQSSDGSDLELTATAPRERIVIYASLRARSADLRMREAFAALEAAELAGAPPADLARRERAFLHATAAYDAAQSLSSQVVVGALPPAEGKRSD